MAFIQLKLVLLALGYKHESEILTQVTSIYLPYMATVFLIMTALSHHTLKRETTNQLCHSQ